MPGGLESVMQKGGDMGEKQDKDLRGSSGWRRGRQEVPWVAQEQGKDRSEVTIVEVGTETLQAWDLLPDPVWQDSTDLVTS